MKLIVSRSQLAGSVTIPGSKSHTIRAVAIASLADGTSYIRRPLVALDAIAAMDASRLLGAEVLKQDDCWVVRGTAGRPHVPENVIDVGNSGTTLYIAMGSAALVNGCSVFTGDEQIRRRPAGPRPPGLTNSGCGRTASTRERSPPRRLPYPGPAGSRSGSG
jgi:3-phosphoshikimate 1-carboxyvinyltransferase